MSETATATAMSLTSLLNSLHSHLQAQTQLLPTLHAQLGLPPTALEDELKVLQDQLIQGVEHQIDVRRKQVDEWMGKCEAVEATCIRYTKALGGNVKATGTSLGELRKEQALPHRYELVTEYQEKLRQAYHTKLEQLTTLTNRLNNLKRTLGSDFYPRDILEMAAATEDPSFDSAVPRDVTPERFLKLEKELVRGKAEVHKRLSQLSTMFIQIDWLYTELGMQPPNADSGLPSYTSFVLGASTSHAQFTSSTTSNALNDPFCVSTPTPASRGASMVPLLFQDSNEAEYQTIFANFVARIEQADEEALAENPVIPLGLENVEPTQALLAWASSTQSSLEDTKRKREAHIQAMYDQLEGLWKRLGVDEADMDAFVEMHRGSTEETVREYEEELERMLELKRERMGHFVQSAREEIIRLWGELMVGDEERADFAPFADDEFTEELLTIHEDEIKRLKEERRLKAPLLAGIKKYFEICEEEKELAVAASDQTRLLGRGRDPGRLLREEKMRKRVQKEKPRLEQDLLASIPMWEQEAGRPFLVHGESILQALMETVSAAEQENKRKPARAGSVPPRATTPVNSNSNGYVPGAKTGVVTPAVRSAPGASHSVPNKRQRLADSSSSSSTLPLGSHRGNATAGLGGGARAVSPTKIPAKTPGGVASSLPRPTSAQHHPHHAMSVPKPGTQHHALGHGRIPSGNTAFGSGSRATRSTSGSAMGHGHGSSTSNKRYTSASHAAAYGAGAGAGATAAVGKGVATGLEMMKNASRARKESFKPRPSADHVELSRSMAPAGGVGPTRWGGGAFAAGAAVREEDED